MGNSSVRTFPDGIVIGLPTATAAANRKQNLFQSWFKKVEPWLHSTRACKQSTSGMLWGVIRNVS